MEQVVLLDEAGHAIGVAGKTEVHHEDTPLHLGFSCYVVNGRGELLLTRRARDKKTWPGVWTNSCCGHPRPGEPLSAAVDRRLRDELGIHAEAIDLVLPAFRYHAVMSNGMSENEMCPVVRGRTEHEPHPDPNEVREFRWVDWAEFASAVTSGTLPVSPWCYYQVQQLQARARHPHEWPVAPHSELPPAARHPSSARATHVPRNPSGGQLPRM